MRQRAMTLAAVATFWAGAARAEEPLVDKVREGSGALMFNLGGIFSSRPGELDDVGIGGRYFLADAMALRGALGFGFGSKETDFESNRDTIEEDSTSVTLEGGVELVLLRSASVYIYTGGIAQLGFGGTETKAGDAESETDVFGLAIGAILGANYFFSQYVSLGAEYRAGIEYRSEDIKDNQETTQTDFATGVVGFHLAFWWH